MGCHHIMVLLVNHRDTKAPELQKVLTELGCNIKMRLGLHEAGDVCSEEGLIILQLCGTQAEISNVEKTINSLDGIKAKYIELSSD